jgi:hypothetical protein
VTRKILKEISKTLLTNTARCDTIKMFQEGTHKTNGKENPRQTRKDILV